MLLEPSNPGQSHVYHVPAALLQQSVELTRSRIDVVLVLRATVKGRSAVG